MEGQLDTYTDAGFTNAANIYRSGGHSKSYSTLQLLSTLTETIPEGTQITGSNDSGDVVTGEAYEEALSGTNILKFRYAVGSSQENYSQCQVGGLQETNTAGCMLTDPHLSFSVIHIISRGGYFVVILLHRFNGKWYVNRG
jgi:hypothetical protein